MNEEEEKDDKDEQVENGWVTMWRALVAIIFILACLTYCSLPEIIEAMK